MRKSGYVLHPNAPFYAMELFNQIEIDLTNKKIKTFVVNGLLYSSENPDSIYSAIKSMINEAEGEVEEYTIGYNLKENIVGYGKYCHGMPVPN